MSSYSIVSNMFRKSESIEIVDAQLRFYEQVNPLSRPRNIRRISATEYEYEFMPAVGIASQEDINYIWTIARNHLWHGATANISDAMKHEYVEYVLTRHSARLIHPDVFTRLISRFMAQPLTPVKLCHQDLTLENVILTTSGRVVLIDPGIHRGLACQEIDEAKLMQSLVTQWEHLHRGWDPWNFSLPFEPTWQHIFILLTHWLRLLAHRSKHTEKTQEIGETFIIPQLVEILEHESGATASDGYRRRLDQFQSICAERISGSVLASRNKTVRKSV